MKKSAPARNPDAYVDALTGWQRDTVEKLRAAVRTNGQLQEQIKWGHLVYTANGPVLLIRAEEQRILFGFWRGKRLRAIEERIKPSGKYEMGTVILREGEGVTRSVAQRLTKAAIELNREFGDPTKL